jgi:hypothetical protein
MNLGMVFKLQAMHLFFCRGQKALQALEGRTTGFLAEGCAILLAIGSFR